MNAASLVSQELESYGVRTFSAKEMAFNILGLMHPLLFSITQVEPIWADLDGGMDRLPDLADITSRIRSDIMKKSDSRRAIARDNASDFKIINGVEAERVLQTVYVTPRANFKFDFPIFPLAESLQDHSKLRKYSVNACDRKCPPSSVLGPGVIETFPVVKPLVAAESRMSSVQAHFETYNLNDAFWTDTTSERRSPTKRDHPTPDSTPLDEGPNPSSYRFSGLRNETETDSSNCRPGSS